MLPFSHLIDRNNFEGFWRIKSEGQVQRRNERIGIQSSVKINHPSDNTQAFTRLAAPGMKPLSALAAAVSRAVHHLPTGDPPGPCHGVPKSAAPAQLPDVPAGYL